MPDTTCHMSMSLDGFVAGPDQSREDPLGKRGRELHGWHIGDPRANDADKVANQWLMRPRGAYVMGRNMFGPIRGDWDEEWTGWWGCVTGFCWRLKLIGCGRAPIGAGRATPCPAGARPGIGRRYPSAMS